LLVFAVVASGCSGLGQDKNQVFLRRSGGTLKEWKTIEQASEIHLPYAWAAVAAYQDSDDCHRSPLDVSVCPEPHAFLSGQGWVLWETLPLLRPRDELPDELKETAETMRGAHLRVEVWSNESRREVIVAFGGTAVSSWEDWKTNLHWFLEPFGVRDEYDVVVDTFFPAFVGEFKKRLSSPGWHWLRTARLVPTGHSLGGGLAQTFAYSAWWETDLPRPLEVYAFDPTPVSAKRSTPAFNKHAAESFPYRGLKIYRIYNRGEILATVRSLLHFGNTDPDNNEQGQNWIDIRYMDDWNWGVVFPTGAVHAHGMHALACFMAQNLGLVATSTASSASGGGGRH
jgi:lipase (class 3)